RPTCASEVGEHICCCRPREVCKCTGGGGEVRQGGGIGSIKIWKLVCSCSSGQLEQHKGRCRDVRLREIAGAVGVQNFIRRQRQRRQLAETAVRVLDAEGRRIDKFILP